MSDQEPPRTAPGLPLSAKMSRLARRDTAPEVALRQALHRRGLRFRLQIKVPGNNRRTIDVALTRAKLAVYIDGCFWHGCPQHHSRPKSNSDWWAWKIERNQARDRDTDRELEVAGWQVVRVWEHEDPEVAAQRVELIYRARRAGPMSGPHHHASARDGELP